MPPSTRIRSIVPRTAKTTTSKSKPVSADGLADALASKLTISETKGKGKAVERTSQERKANAMRAVNAASKSLSALLEQRSKASRAKPDRAATESIMRQAKSARKDLNVLRELSSGEVDIERAASSMVGKLINLQMVCRGIPFLRRVLTRP